MSRQATLFADLVPPDRVSLSPVRPRNPVAIERIRLNAAAERVLAYLQRHGEASNVELCDPGIGGMRFGGRIFELRKRGHDIRRKHVGGGLWRYAYHRIKAL